MAPRLTTRELALICAFAIFSFISSTSAPNAALDRGRVYLASTASSKGIKWPWANSAPSSITLPQPGFLDTARQMWGDGLPPETKVLAHKPGNRSIHGVYRMLIM